MHLFTFENYFFRRQYKVAICPLTLKCLSNGNKNSIFAEANVSNNSAKFQLYPPTASEELIFEYFS